MDADVTIIVVSTNEAKWLERCLGTAYAQAGSAELDVVVVDNESSDGTGDLIRSHFPAARVVDSENRGFPHANNRALMTPLGRYVLFLNPDTEIIDGEFGELVEFLDARPEIGLLGVKQVTDARHLSPTIRRFPSPLRALGEALVPERLRKASWLGESELDPDRYERECECDWTVGAFMLARREALFSGGFMDERFFLYSDEPDLCLRMHQSGWRIVHSPAMTIVHHANKAGVNPILEAQDAFSRRLYAEKHFPPLRRFLYLGALVLRYALRATVPRDADTRSAARRSLSTLLGRSEPPFGEPPSTSVVPSTPRATAVL